MKSDAFTVREFKKIINDWPEEYEDGSLTEVWLETGLHLSSPCINITPLNLRKYDDGTSASDIILAPNVATWIKQDETVGVDIARRNRSKCNNLTDTERDNLIKIADRLIEGK